jgi:hypothetical protein
MGLIYGNDWFVIPFEMPVNSLCEVLGLVVTTVFGDRTLIPAANAPDESIWQRWSFFSVTGRAATTGAAGSSGCQPRSRPSIRASQSRK